MAPCSCPDPLGQRTHLCGHEVIDLDGDALTAEFADQLGGLLDGFRPVVVGLLVAGNAAATGADDGCSGLAQRRGDTPPGAAGRSGDHGDAAAQGLGVRRPFHGTSIACYADGLPDFAMLAHTREDDTVAALHRRRNRH